MNKLNACSLCLQQRPLRHDFIWNRTLCSCFWPWGSLFSVTPCLVGLKCRTPLHEECPQHHGLKDDTQHLWCRWWEGPSNLRVDEVPRPDGGNASHPQKLGIKPIMPYIMSSLWCPESRLLKNISIGSVT